MPHFRKKPVVIEAIRWDGENQMDIMKWAGGSIVTQFASDLDHLNVETLEGVTKASKGDFIIKGVKGEFCPCKPDIFAATYEPV